jgi:hypothetical protein
MDPNAHRRPRSGSVCGSNLSDRGRDRTFCLRIVSAGDRTDPRAADPFEAMRCNARMALVIGPINPVGRGVGTNSNGMSLAIRDAGG